MKRVTISVDEAVLEAARSDVAAGRAASVSAWVGDAMRHKLLARVELLTELEEMAAERPYTTDTIDWVAETLGRPGSPVFSAAASSTNVHSTHTPPAESACSRRTPVPAMWSTGTSPRSPRRLSRGC